MRIEWDDEQPFEPGLRTTELPATRQEPPMGAKRLDLLLPTDEQTGAASAAALNAYIDTMIDLVSRSSQPISLLCIAVDETPIIRFFGTDGVKLIGRAVARCIRQETRTYDVVGRSDIDPDVAMPIFIVACPLSDEEHASQLGERLRAAMSAFADADRPWLTLSVGVAALALDMTDGRELMARAYAAMRRAQRMGGGKVWRSSATTRAVMEQQEPEPPDASS